MPRPRSSTFYLPLAPLDAPLSLKAKLSVLPPQAANALLAPRARSSTVSCSPSSNSDLANLSAHDTPSPLAELGEDECARLERVLGCATRAKDGTSRYRAASPELIRNDWSTPSPPRSPPHSPNPSNPKEIIHVDMDLDPPPIVTSLPTPPLTPGSSAADHGHSAIPPEPTQASDHPEMVYELDNDELTSDASSLATSPCTEGFAAVASPTYSTRSTSHLDLAFVTPPPTAEDAQQVLEVQQPRPLVQPLLQQATVVRLHELCIGSTIVTPITPVSPAPPPAPVLAPVPAPVPVPAPAPAPSPSVLAFTLTSTPCTDIPHGWYAILATRPRVSSPLSLLCQSLSITEEDGKEEYEWTEQVDMQRVWGAVDDTPLPMDCRAYLKRECRMPLPPPPPPCPPAPAPVIIPTPTPLCPTLAAQAFPVTTAQLHPDADAEMTPCEPVESALAPVPASPPALVPAPFIRPRYKTAIPLSRKILRRAFGATTWERNEKLRLARMADQGAFTFPMAFDFDSLVSPVPLPMPATAASQNAVLAKLASFGEFKAGTGVEFCGGATFWEGEDGEEMEMELCDEDFTGMLDDTEWGGDEGDFEPIDEVDVNGEWEDDTREHEPWHGHECDEPQHEHEHPEPVGAGEDVDIRVVFDEETEIVRSLGEIRSAAWPPAMSRPRTRSGGRIGDLRRMEEQEMQYSLGDVEDGEDIFRYRPLDESELEEWQARQSQEFQPFSNTGMDAEEIFFDPDTRPKEEREQAQQVQVESPVEMRPQSHPRVVLQEIPASPMVDRFPSDATASILVQCLEERVDRMGTEQSQSLSPNLSPRPPVLLAPAPKHAWAFSSIKNALSSSVNSLIARSRSASPLPWLRSQSSSPAPSLEDMVCLPGTPPLRSPLSQEQDVREDEACTTPTPSNPRDWDSWSQSSTRTATPGLSESDSTPTKPSTSAPPSSEQLVIVSSPPKRTLSTSSMSSVASEAESESGSSAASNGEGGTASGYSRSPSPEPSSDRAEYFQPNWWDGNYSLAPPSFARKDLSGMGPGLTRSGSPNVMPGSWDPFDMDGWEDACER